MNPAGVAPETINYMFGGFLAGFLLITVWVGRLSFRLSALSRRLDRQGQGPCGRGQAGFETLKQAPAEIS